MAAPIPFSRIWENYPSEQPCLDKTGRPPHGWANQCAVRVSVALERSGVSFKSFPPGGRCPLGAANNAMIGSAQRLANWLRLRPFPGCPPPLAVGGATWEASLKGRTGIVFFENYWRRRGESAGFGTGDHIDLWNRDTLTPSLQSFLRFSLGLQRVPNLNPFSDEENVMSDLRNSAHVVFWPIS
jgi:hypothetical protein